MSKKIASALALRLPSRCSASLPATRATLAAGPCTAAARYFSSTPSASGSTSDGKTALHDFHVAKGGKMVSFGGYSMPLWYSDATALASHHHVRNHAGLFDVGHMVQHFFSGPGALGFLQRLTPSSLSSLEPFSSTLSVLVNDAGGILDDTVVTRHEAERFYVVTNAGRRTEDLDWIKKQLEAWRAKGGASVEHEILHDHGLLALQGPASAEVLSKHTSADLAALTFGKSTYATVAGVEGCHIARGGYTGEDGFEISVPSPAGTITVAEALTATDPVQLAGLAPRDSLRLEAGMCLYGHDLDETVSPVEGGLAWVIGKDRRESADFIGAQPILDQLKNGPSRRRVGIISTGPPAREGTEIYDAEGKEKIGEFCSPCAWLPLPCRLTHSVLFPSQVPSLRVSLLPRSARMSPWATSATVTTRRTRRFSSRSVTRSSPHKLRGCLSCPTSSIAAKVRNHVVRERKVTNQNFHRTREGIGYLQLKGCV